MKFVFSRGLAEAGRVRGWLDIREEFRVTEEDAGRGFMEEGRESKDDWKIYILFANYLQKFHP